MHKSLKNKVSFVCIVALLGGCVTGLSACGKDKESAETPAQTTAASASDESATQEKVKETDKKTEEEKGFNEEAVYHNNKKLSYDYGDGTISVGMDKGPDDQYIYLNVSCSEAQDTNEIGYYLEVDRSTLEFSNDPANITCDIGFNESETDFAIVDRLYSSVVPVRYVDQENFGVRWCDDMLEDDTNGGATIAIRAVNLKTYELVAICDAVIEYDEKTNSYALTALKSGDVKDNKELDDTSRSNIVKKSAEFAAERLHVDASNFDTGKAIVDKHDGTYFSKFLDEDDSTLYYKDYTTCSYTYAVNLPSAEYGFVTVYFAPQTQLIGLTSPTEPGKTDLKLKLYGYDPVRPFDFTTIIAPEGFLS